MTWTAALGALNDTVVATFGADMLYEGSAIRGVFTEDYIDVTLGEVAVESGRPAVLARESDVPGVAHGSEFVIDGAEYQVTNVQPDGGGMLLLMLEKQ